MNVGLYLFLTFVAIMIIVNNSEDEHEGNKHKSIASGIKKPDINKIHQTSSRELRDMFRSSMDKINEEYDRIDRSFDKKEY